MLEKYQENQNAWSKLSEEEVGGSIDRQGARSRSYRACGNSNDLEFHLKYDEKPLEFGQGERQSEAYLKSIILVAG